MPRRGVRSFRQVKAPGSWAGLAVAQTAVPAASKVLLGSFGPEVGDPPLTVRRFRIGLAWSSDQWTTNEEPFGAFAIGIFSDISIAAGVASLPGPITDIGDDVWMCYQPVNIRFGGAVAPTAFAIADRWYDIDSKAMRKLPEGKSAALIIENAHATHGANVQVTARSYATFAR